MIFQMIYFFRISYSILCEKNLVFRISYRQGFIDDYRLKEVLLFLESLVESLRHVCEKVLTCFSNFLSNERTLNQDSYSRIFNSSKVSLSLCLYHASFNPFKELEELR